MAKYYSYALYATFPANLILRRNVPRARTTRPHRASTRPPSYRFAARVHKGRGSTSALSPWRYCKNSIFASELHRRCRINVLFFFSPGEKSPLALKPSLGSGAGKTRRGVYTSGESGSFSNNRFVARTRSPIFIKVNASASWNAKNCRLISDSAFRGTRRVSRLSGYASRKIHRWSAVERARAYSPLQVKCTRARVYVRARTHAR